MSKIHFLKTVKITLLMQIDKLCEVTVRSLWDLLAFTRLQVLNVPVFVALIQAPNMLETESLARPEFWILSRYLPFGLQEILNFELFWKIPQSPSNYIKLPCLSVRWAKRDNRWAKRDKRWAKRDQRWAKRDQRWLRLSLPPTYILCARKNASNIDFPPRQIQEHYPTMNNNKRKKNSPMPLLPLMTKI